MNKKGKKVNKFSKITLSLASPESILDISYGEVVTPETINYKNCRAEFGGLFCERIFGPTRNYMCFCGKYKGIRYRGIICDECGVEVIEKKSRRERWGHIVLATPIANTWFFKQIPCKIGGIIGIPYTQLNKLIYYDAYIIINPGVMAEKGLKRLDLIDIDKYNEIISSLPEGNQDLPNSDPDKFIAKIGAEAVYDLLRDTDLDALYAELKEKLKTSNVDDRNTIVTRLKLVRSFINSRKVIENRPEWMVFKILPVMPADLRPLMIIDGTVTTVDLNDLYRSVIISNNRLKKLIEVGAPEIVLRNEKRMLQKAVDSLIDNSGSHNVKNERVLKSLTELIKGKEGRFRQNLLGKRVDYSGRSVIVINPKLRIYECGVPKEMAVELFKPIIINKLLKRGYISNVNEGEGVLKDRHPIIFDILENLLKGYPVLLNRAPTLHRMNVQAFQPRLVEGEAIELNPLVCAQFNADFDGDQMAIHIPITLSSKLEASTLVLAGNNVLRTSDGTPCFMPSHEMCLGLYYLTMKKKVGESYDDCLTFGTKDEVVLAIECGKIKLHSNIKFRNRRILKEKYINEIINTTAGRVIFNSYLPDDWSFVNDNVSKNKLKNIIQRYSNENKPADVVSFLDNIKTLGFVYAYKSGLSFKMSDIIIPDKKQEIINKAVDTINIINKRYFEGFISDKGRYNQVLDAWTKSSLEISKELISSYKNNENDFNGIYLMLISGSRGSWEQLRQIAGMKGLISKSQRNASDDSNSIIEYPITSNFKEGLDVLEYFISTYGGRKGMTDTALKTANAGYLTRKLVDVAQDVIINEYDCCTPREYCINTEDCLEDGSTDFMTSFINKVTGRISSRTIKNIQYNTIIINRNELIDEQKAKLLFENGIEKVYVRSVLTCECKNGLCSLCYGNSLATGTLSQIGDAVGVIAAQSIGEPGTQLTLNTFHFGGIASSKVLESSKYSKYEGVVDIKDCNCIKKDDKNIVISSFCKIYILHPITSFVLVKYDVPYGANIYVEQGSKVKQNDLLFDWDPYFSLFFALNKGVVKYENFGDNVILKEEKNQKTGRTEYIVFDIKDKNKTYLLLKYETSEIRINVYLKSRIFFKDGEHVNEGDIIIKTPKVLVQSTDITGGLPRVTELFEGKTRVNAATLSEIDGIVKIVSIDKNKINLTVQSNTTDYKCNYLIPINTDLLVQDGEIIECGAKLNSGEINVDDILNTQGYFAVCNYLIKELQLVYSLQGVNISSKHISVIVSKMLSFVEILETGDTDYIVGEIISKSNFMNTNCSLRDKYYIIDNGDSMKYKKGQMISYRDYSFENTRLSELGQRQMEVRKAVQAKSKIIIRGISQVSLSAEGFLAPASFQSTVNILNQAAIAATVDDFKGIKANVISGRMIQAGTGISRFYDIDVSCN